LCGQGSDAAGGRWTKEEDQKLRAAVAAVGPRNWKGIADEYFDGTHTDTQCLNRWYKVSSSRPHALRPQSRGLSRPPDVQVLRPGLVKGPWTKEEDEIIIRCMTLGITKWSEIAERIPGRLGKQVRPATHHNPPLHALITRQRVESLATSPHATSPNATPARRCLT
jgi:hypothetical protein